MSIDSLIDAMELIDDEKLQKAHDTVSAERKPIVRWWKPAVSVAAAIVFLLVVLTASRLTSDHVIYADDFSRGALLNYDQDSKVTFGDSLKELKGDAKVRVAISVHEFFDAYPEYGFSWKEDTTWKDYLIFEQQVMECEKTFLKEIGAKRFAKTERNVFICTMRVRDMPKLSDGKCKYTVVMYTANNHDIKHRDVSYYDGEYSCQGLVAMPILSSFFPTKEFTESGRLRIEDERVSISFENISYDNCVCEQVNEDTLDESSHMFWNENVLFSELKYASRKSYKVKSEDGNRFCYLYLTNDAIYVDLGYSGIYMFR